MGERENKGSESTIEATKNLTVVSAFKLVTFKLVCQFDLQGLAKFILPLFEQVSE